MNLLSSLLVDGFTLHHREFSYLPPCKRNAHHDGYLGLFSVPAPPLRLPRSAGFFIEFIRRRVLVVLPTLAPSNIWSASSNLAQLDLNGLQATLDILRPWEGLQVVVQEEKVAPTSLFRINSNPGTETETLADAYTRDRDLVVLYSQTNTRPNSLQLYWRGLVDEHGCIVDQIVSTQTDQLDSDPSLSVQHQLPPGDVVSFTSQCASLLFRPQGWSHSWLFIAKRADCEALSIDEGDQPLVSFHLFRRSLEKGVIRRALLRAILLPRENDIHVAGLCERTFLAAELPLTT